MNVSLYVPLYIFVPFLYLCLYGCVNKCKYVGLNVRVCVYKYVCMYIMFGLCIYVFV